MNWSQVRRMIAAGLIGNVLEWYDFAIYGYFATAIGHHFFPHEDAVVGIAGYLLRRHVLDNVPTEQRERAPIVETLHDHWPIVLGFAGYRYSTQSASMSASSTS